MLETMNPRERVLLGATGAVIAVVLSFFLVKFFLTQRTEYARQLAVTRGRIDLLKQRESERELWSRRDRWLTEKLPSLGDPDEANKSLREWVLALAKKHTVTIEAPSPGTPTNQPGHISLALRFEAKAPWDAMMSFLYEVQGVENFTAIESCDLAVNKEDKTQLKATITIARWFAPRQAVP